MIWRVTRGERLNGTPTFVEAEHYYAAREIARAECGQGAEVEAVPMTIETLGASLPARLGFRLFAEGRS